MGLTCGKEQFDVDKKSQFTSQGDGFYRTFEHLSYWSAAKNGKGEQRQQPQQQQHHVEFEINNAENRSVASTIPINGNGKSESSSIDGEESKSATMKTIDE